MNAGRFRTSGWAIFLCVAAAWTLVTRFWGLELRPYHVDEARLQFEGFSYYKYLFHGFEGGLYRYNPFMHGPLFVHFMIPIYALAGPTLFAVRLPTALFGCLTVFTPLLFRRTASRTAMGWAIALLATSSTLTFSSRITRQDFMYQFFSVLAVFFLFRFLECRRRGDGLRGALFYALAFCCKEEIYILTGQVLMFLIFYAWKRILDRDRFHARVRGFLKKEWRVLAAGGAVFLLVYALYFTSGFQNPGGFLEGFIPALKHWQAQHGRGPEERGFLYYFRLLYLREAALLVFLAGCAGVASWREKWMLPFWAFLLASCAYLMGSPQSHARLPPILDVFHLETAGDLAAVFFVSLAGWTVFLNGIYSGRQGSAPALLTPFLYFWAFSGFLIYSFIGEKLPWLMLHFQIPLVFCAIRAFDQLNLARWGGNRGTRVLGTAAMAGLILFQARISLRETFIRAESRMSFGYRQWTYAPGSWDFAAGIMRYARASGKGKNLRVHLIDSDGVIGAIARAYLVDAVDRFQWGGGENLKEADMVVVNRILAAQMEDIISAGFQKVDYHLQDLNDINFRKLNWKGLFEFYGRPEEFSHGHAGRYDAVVYYRRT